jgi:hypothetical protein
VLWYQGESNADAHTDNYGCLFNSMIRSWRETMSIGNYGFNFVQLPPSVPYNDTNSTDDGARQFPTIRAAQAEALPMPGGASDVTAMAVTLDLGGAGAWGPLHPVRFGEGGVERKNQEDKQNLLLCKPSLSVWCNCSWNIAFISQKCAIQPCH